MACLNSESKNFEVMLAKRSEIASCGEPNIVGNGDYLENMKKYAIKIMISFIITILISILFWGGAITPTIITFLIIMFILGGVRSLKEVTQDSVKHLDVINGILNIVGIVILALFVLFDLNNVFLILGLIIFLPTFMGKIIYQLMKRYSRRRTDVNDKRE